MLRFGLLFIALLQILHIQAKSQYNQVTDSLLLLLQNTHEDTIRIHCYNELSFHNIYIDIEKTRLYADSAMQIAEKGNYPLGLAKAKRLMGIYYMFISDIPMALEFINEALIIAEQINHTQLKAKCYNILGTLYRRLAAYDKALDYHYKAVYMEDKLNETNNKTRNLLSIAIIHRLIGNYEKSMDHLKEVEPICYELKDTFLIGNYHYELAALKYATQEYSLSEYHCNKAAFFFEVINSEYNLLNAISLKALLLSAQGRGMEAIEIYKQSVQRSKKIGNKHGMMQDYLIIANTYLQLNDLQNAKKNAQIAISLGEELGVELKLKSAYRTLYQVSEIEKDYQSALRCHKKLKEISDSVFSNEKSKQIDNLEIIYEVDKKERQIELLKIDALLKDKEAKIQKLHKKIAMGGAAVFFILLIMAGNRLKLRRKLFQQKEAKLLAEAKYREEEALRKEEELRATAEINKINAERIQDELEHRNREITSSALYVAQKNEILGSIDEKLSDIKDKVKAEFKKDITELKRLIKDNIELDEDWNNFKLHFEKVHPRFFETLASKYPELTPNEQKTCAYIRMNLSGKEIARLLNITPKSTQMSRYRLKKKFNLSVDDDLLDFIKNI